MKYSREDALASPRVEATSHAVLNDPAARNVNSVLTYPIRAVRCCQVLPCWQSIPRRRTARAASQPQSLPHRRSCKFPTRSHLKRREHFMLFPSLHLIGKRSYARLSQSSQSLHCSEISRSDYPHCTIYT